MVLGPLGRDFELKVVPLFASGITAAKFLTGSLGAPQAVDLNLIDAIGVKGTPNEPPQVSFVTHQ